MDINIKKVLLMLITSVSAILTCCMILRCSAFFATNSVDEIVLDNVLEHLDKHLKFLTKLSVSYIESAPMEPMCV